MSTLQRVINAKNFALVAHQGQKYGPDLPYEYHLLKVLAVGQRHVTDAMLVWAGITRCEFECGCMLHDTPEDAGKGRSKDKSRPVWMTKFMLDLIAASFGPAVHSMVWAVTDATGENRKARKWGSAMEPGPMLKLPTEPGGLILKLVDRIANVEACIAGDEKLPPHKKSKSLISTYREEQADLRTLRTDGPLGPLWDHLETLLKVQP